MEMAREALPPSTGSPATDKTSCTKTPPSPSSTASSSPPPARVAARAATTGAASPATWTRPTTPAPGGRSASRIWMMARVPPT